MESASIAAFKASTLSFFFPKIAALSGTEMKYELSSEDLIVSIKDDLDNSYIASSTSIGSFWLRNNTASNATSGIIDRQLETVKKTRFAIGDR